jgi:hypothetical protein
MPTSKAQMSWRVTSEADLEACLEIQLAHLGDELVGASVARKVWKDLLHHPSLVTAVFEYDPPIHGHRIVGFGASVFVSPAFADSEIANPRPGINSRIVASLHEGRSALLSRAEVARANTGAGLDVVILYGSWRAAILSPRQCIDVETLMPLSFASLHAGFRLNRTLWEAAGENEIRFARTSGVYRAIGEYPKLNSVLNVITPNDAFAMQGSVARSMYTYREPLLRLNESDQQLLAAAQEGATDAELASALHLTLPAVKARWRSIFAHVREVRPQLEDEFGGERGRGPQKRHRVLAYVREHPEELRPYPRTRR